MISLLFTALVSAAATPAQSNPFPAYAPKDTVLFKIGADQYRSKALEVMTRPEVLDSDPYGFRVFRAHYDDNGKVLKDITDISGAPAEYPAIPTDVLNEADKKLEFYSYTVSSVGQGDYDLVRAGSASQSKWLFAYEIRYSSECSKIIAYSHYLNGTQSRKEFLSGAASHGCIDQ
jgi:hypothetical protein